MHWTCLEKTRILKLAVLAALFFWGCGVPLYGQFCHAAQATTDFGSVPSNPTNVVGDLKNKVKFPKMDSISSQDIDMSADTYEYVGSNLIARGHAVIRLKDMQVTADSVVINLLTKDMEAVGNVIFSARVTESILVSPSEYESYLQDPAVKIVADGISTFPDGNQKIKATLISNSAYMKAERASGSLETGAFQFRNFMIKAGFMYFTGSLADRYPNGTLKLFGARMTTCEYKMDGNAHYEIGSHEMTLKPREANRSIYNYNPDHGEHSVLAFNNFFRLWDVPVFWIPAFYKPADTNTFGIRFEYGNSSRFGNYVRTSKEFEILSEPFIARAALMVDYYQQRGFGFGGTADILTKNSKTEFFGYMINDRNPYDYWNSPRNDAPDGYTEQEWIQKYSRFEIPNMRYELRLSNITHLTPRLDFRGQIDAISDYNFLQDYFQSRYNNDIQPPTFAALEYQGERFSATLQTVIKVNSFDSTVQRLPEIRLDFQRQELFRNIYYQGQTSAGFYKMSWRDYTFSRDQNPNINFPQILKNENQSYLQPVINSFGDDTQGAAQYLMNLNPEAYNPYFSDPKDYSTFRFDTLHAFYYPFKLFDVVNLIPRAIGRFTAYSDSSKANIDVNKLYSMYADDQLDNWPPSTLKVYSYDRDGGAQYRFAFELGLEGNMKFYRAWQDAKSAFLQIDGLRHVMVPYFNFVYMPPPTVDYQNIYYFDDVDQLDKQAFVRLGLQNRLQTRRNDVLYEWISLENYWDFHFEKTDGFNQIGDLGTILKFSPTENLTFTTELLLDIGDNNSGQESTAQSGDDSGNGISGNFINQLNMTLAYKITKDWILSASYFYSDTYAQRTAYSMGSTLAQINSTSYFQTYYQKHQFLGLGLTFPSMIDDRLKGNISISYDVDANLFNQLGLSLRRDFHCWYVAAGIGANSVKNANEQTTWPFSFSFTLGLTAMPGMAYNASTSVAPGSSD